LGIETTTAASIGSESSQEKKILQMRERGKKGAKVQFGKGERGRLKEGVERAG